MWQLPWQAAQRVRRRQVRCAGCRKAALLRYGVSLRYIAKFLGIVPRRTSNADYHGTQLELHRARTKCVLKLMPNMEGAHPASAILLEWVGCKAVPAVDGVKLRWLF